MNVEIVTHSSMFLGASEQNELNVEMALPM